ncbi:MAG TPA: sulfotransferase domain-containing protein [Caulobacteraceae bacterium]|nr:sulfotransferase domain-containing protein [Caulobacteraceae bacterium]
MDASARPTRAHRYETAVADSGRWDAYRPRAGDVIVATAPKCGTTWTQMICALLIHGPALPRPLTRLSPWLDRVSEPIEAVIDGLERQPWRRVIKTHTPLDGLPYFDDVDYVFCGRDVRDAFLSMMAAMANISAATMEAVRRRIGAPDGFAFPADPNAFFPVWMTQPIQGWVEDGFPTGSVFATARAFWRFRGLPNVHFTHYRDLTLDLAAEMRRLATALGVEVAETDWPPLLDAAGFRAMAAHADDTAPGAHLGEWTSNRAFFDTARLGAWRDVLTDANQALYTELAPQRVGPALQAWLEGGRAVPGDPRRL